MVTRVNSDSQIVLLLDASGELIAQPYQSYSHIWVWDEVLRSSDYVASKVTRSDLADYYCLTSEQTDWILSTWGNPRKDGNFQYSIGNLVGGWFQTRSGVKIEGTDLSDLLIAQIKNYAHLINMRSALAACGASVQKIDLQIADAKRAYYDAIPRPGYDKTVFINLLAGYTFRKSYNWDPCADEFPGFVQSLCQNFLEDCWFPLLKELYISKGIEKYSHSALCNSLPEGAFSILYAEASSAASKLYTIKQHA